MKRFIICFFVILSICLIGCSNDVIEGRLKEHEIVPFTDGALIRLEFEDDRVIVFNDSADGFVFKKGKINRIEYRENWHNNVTVRSVEILSD
jgi:hypothetical protein